MTFREKRMDGTKGQARVYQWMRDNRKVLITTLLFGLLPLFLCLIYCALYHKTLWQLFLPGSYWNDELFYYKQVEGILTRGVPGGYFGFNESRGRYLSFAAWSPLLLWQWCIWGFLFGWNYLSPILCNLFCMMAGMAGFAWIARPKKRQAVVILILFSLFTPFTRFTLSATSEIPCLSLLLFYMGLAFRHRELGRNKDLWKMLIAAGILTLMRPYFVLLLLYPAWYYGRQGKKKCFAAVVTVFSFSCGYAAIKYLFSADYLQELFDTSFLTVFWQQGIGAGVRNLWDLTVDGMKVILFSYLKLALRIGHFAGSLYAVFGLLGAAFLIAAFWERSKRKEQGNLFWMFLSLTAAFAAMMAAILFMYKTGEGSRHLFSFILMGILLLGMYQSKRGLLLQILLACVMGYFFVCLAGTPYDYQIPMGDEKLRTELAELQSQLESTMELQEGISWNNTVIWLSYDLVDGEVVAEQWQQLYAIPAGFGINFCPRDYVYDNLEQVKSRYIAAVTGGDVEQQLKETGALRLAGNDKVTVYDLKIN